MISALSLGVAFVSTLSSQTGPSTKFSSGPLEAALYAGVPESRVELWLQAGSAKLKLADLVVHQQVPGLEAPKPIEVLGWRRGPALKSVDLAMVAADYDDSKWKAVNDYDVPEHSIVVFRASVDVRADVALAKGTLLHVTAIDDRSTVYINGQEVGKSSLWDQPSWHLADGKLKAGRNVIAVAVENDGGPGGMANSVEIVPSSKPKDYRNSPSITPFPESFTSSGIQYRREAFGSSADRVLVYRFEASKKGSLSLSIKLAGVPESGGRVDVAGNLLMASSAQNVPVVIGLRILNQGGKVNASMGSIELSGADSATILATGQTGSPADLEKIAGILSQAASKGYAGLRRGAGR